MSILLAPFMETSLEQLVRQSQAGCRDSFELLVAQFEERIFNFLYQIVGNHHDAEDLTQDTFVKAYLNLNRFDSHYAFSTWIFTIAKRIAFSHCRSNKSTQTMPEDGEIDWRDPAASLAEKDESQALWGLAKRLKPSQYEVLWLTYGEGFSIVETAKIMHTNQIRVRVLLHRARNQMAKWLKGSAAEVLWQNKTVGQGQII